MSPLSLAEVRFTQLLATANHAEGIATLVTSDKLAQVCDALIELRQLAERYAGECGVCDGSGLVSKKFFVEGIEHDADDQPCEECADIRAALAKVRA